MEEGKACFDKLKGGKSSSFSLFLFLEQCMHVDTGQCNFYLQPSAVFHLQNCPVNMVLFNAHLFNQRCSKCGALKHSPPKLVLSVCHGFGSLTVGTSISAQDCLGRLAGLGGACASRVPLARSRALGKSPGRNPSHTGLDSLYRTSYPSVPPCHGHFQMFTNPYVPQTRRVDSTVS